MPNTSETPRFKLSSLESGRAVAAILVVLFHESRSYFGVARYWPDQIAGGLFDFGHSGVYFFFVLSGFIILHAHCHDIGKSLCLIPYLKKRAIRIYPVYWIVLTIAFLLFRMSPAIGEPFQKDISTFIFSFFLIGPDPDRTVVAVAWTLYYEVLFYAVFGIFILSRRWGLTLLLVWSATMVVLLMERVEYVYALAPVNILFLLGMFVKFVAGSPFRAPRIYIWLGLSLFLMTGLDEVFFKRGGDSERVFAYGISSAIIVFGLVQAESFSNLKPPRMLVFLGQCSYSIYLIHIFSLSLCARAIFAIGLQHVLPPSIYFILLFVFVLLSGVVLHVAVERPLLSHSRRWLRLS